MIDILSIYLYYDLYSKVSYEIPEFILNIF
jgi:hypothetical protein